MRYKFIVLYLCLCNSWTMQGWYTRLPRCHHRGHNPCLTHHHCSHCLPHQQETEDWWVPVTIEAYKLWFMRRPAIPVYRNLNAVMHLCLKWMLLMYTDEHAWPRICPNNIYDAGTVCHILTQVEVAITNSASL